MGIKSSIAKKVAMARSGFFLILYLLQHLAVNLLTVCDPALFNEVAEFMGTNPFVQYFLQPILFFGFIFHLVMGIVLEDRNNRSRPVKYARKSPGSTSTWMSRNMLITGLMILSFLVLHLVDFFFPTIKAHYITHEALDSYAMVAEKFTSPVYVLIYVVAFIFLALHLMHGFQSAFQSTGFRHTKYTPFIKKLGTLYAIIVPLGFIYIAIHHYIISL